MATDGKRLRNSEPQLGSRKRQDVDCERYAVAPNPKRKDHGVSYVGPPPSLPGSGSWAGSGSDLSSDLWQKCGQDPLTNQSGVGSRKNDQDQLAAQAKTGAETLPDGIHPSRLAFFAIEEATDDFGMATAIVMAPPGHSQRNPHSQSHSQSQPPPAQSQSQSQSQGHAKSVMPSSNLNGNHQQQQQQQKFSASDKDPRPRQNNGRPASPTVPIRMASHIQVAKPYVFQQAIEGCLKDVGVAQAREDNIRLAGVQWIDSVRRALKLPVKTFDTAVIYFHKFRLVHSDGEYSFVDAAAAALFAACKIEDTLKKSRDILCAAHNLKITNRAEHLAPDDSLFEHHSRTIIGLERLILESSSFDFRNRHPQHLLIKIAKGYSISRSSPIMAMAYKISLDLYRTFAPLKHSTAALAFACLELSVRLLKEADDQPGVQNILSGAHYERWNISRVEVTETLLDLLELYTHYRTSTILGPDFALDAFLEVRIPLNEELSAKDLPRFTEYVDPGLISKRADVGSYAATVNGVSAASTAANGISRTNTTASPNTSPTTTTNTAAQNGPRQKAGDRGKEGTVRFILNPDREREERAIVAEYGPQHGHASTHHPPR